MYNQESKDRLYIWSFMQSFYFQHPKKSGIINKITESLVQHEKYMKKAFGIFAFASSSGISAFFQNENMEKFLKQNHLVLYIGLNAITNTQSLKTLNHILSRYKNVEIEFFYSCEHSSIFHPKVFWIEYSSNESPVFIKVFTGSGNLTGSGLGECKTKNWEFFSINQINCDQDIHSFTSEILEWKNIYNSFFFKISNQIVIEQAIKNSRKKIKTTKSIPPSSLLSDIVSSIEENTENNVVIREISKNRPGQADIGKEIFDFLSGSDEKEDKYKIFVSTDGNETNVSTTKLFKNKSHNFRFEAPELSSLLNQQIPIEDILLLIIKFNENCFGYSFIVKNEDNSLFNNLQKQLPKKEGNKKRHIFMQSSQLEHIWQSIPDQLKVNYIDYLPTH